MLITVEEAREDFQYLPVLTEGPQSPVHQRRPLLPLLQTYNTMPEGTEISFGWKRMETADQSKGVWGKVRERQGYAGRPVRPC